VLRLILFLTLAVGAVSGCHQERVAEPESTRLHAFYYPWYGTPELDGEYIHWRHDVMAAGDTKTYPGGDNIGADFYPQGGCYSSGDPEVLHRQMRQLEQAGIGVICVSWLGSDSSEARVLPGIMKIAAEHGILVNFHLEPAVQQSIKKIREAIVYLVDQYGDHPAFYRAPETGGRGMFYVYDSYLTPANEWARLLTTNGDLTIRGTAYDAAVVGLILNENDTGFIEAAGMDGGYAYFVVDGFSYASTTANWPALVAWAREKDLLFIPSVGPGYSDLRIRPWNQGNQRPREAGRYYDCLFSKAIEADPAIIAITSFNEWHEGTQIEPAMPFVIDQFAYLDYQPLLPNAYLDRTAAWVNKWSHYHQGTWAPDSLHHQPCAEGISRNTVLHLAVGKKLQLATSFSEKYMAGGNSALLDGITGSNSYRDGCWQGYEGVDLIAEIDLGQAEPVSGLQVGFLIDSQVWIFPPRGLRVEGSADGSAYQLLATATPNIPPNAMDPFRHEQTVTFEEQPLRFIRVTVESEKKCPAGHPGSGQPAWLFVDEIQVFSCGLPLLDSSTFPSY